MYQNYNQLFFGKSHNILVEISFLRGKKNIKTVHFIRK